MKLQKFCAFILIALSSVTIISCGSGGAAATGGDVFLSTSKIAANANPSSIDADVMADVGSTVGIHKDTVSASITSTVTATPALPVQVNFVTVSYVAVNGGPALATETYGINSTAAGGSIQTFAVDAATLNQKQIVAAVYTGTPASYDYDVTLTFNVSEVGGTNPRSGSPVTHTTIHFAQFKDS